MFLLDFGINAAKSAAKTLVTMRQEEKKKRIIRKQAKKNKCNDANENAKNFSQLESLTANISKMASKLLEDKPEASNIDYSDKMFDFVEAIETNALANESDIQLLQRVAYKPQFTQLFSKHFARLTKHCSNIPDESEPELLHILLRKLINICKGIES